jgi:hypothetical protein
LANTLNKIITHCRCLADHFTLHCKHFFTHLWTFYTFILQILHSVHLCHKPHISYNGFLAALMFLALRKEIAVQILQLAGLSLTEHITHCRDKNTVHSLIIIKYFHTENYLRLGQSWKGKLIMYMYVSSFW